MTLDSPNSMHAPSKEHIRKHTWFCSKEGGGLAKILSNEEEGCNKGFLNALTEDKWLATQKIDPPCAVYVSTGHGASDGPRVVKWEGKCRTPLPSTVACLVVSRMK
ncbi:F15O4.23 [Arabidopsis thaliana]|uniref:F15O4.23 n=1 Tax=Arabidopsis thaliana TaxID=3702 RepID=Q9LQG2_ARATH|nr:F15O4.23 [Arabidopsis thaliana]